MTSISHSAAAADVRAVPKAKARNASIDRTRTFLTLVVLIHHAVIPYTHFGHTDPASWIGFDFVVAAKNFKLSCDLYGKANVAGYGHWHANVDSSTKGMMGMATMLGMSCGKSFHVSLAGVKPGTHRFIAILEDNTHAPTIGVQASVNVTVK